ncbi:MATE family efflux transporter [Helicobacter ibis]|uniref:Multidrug export protein MepA n=1 Tax=Helicobacter ibis TaxID=2962633 RepID=A0ABT4VDZ0_9HELI|nr:MATE family efflux transporter [Helicobacter ibis]MDA3968914.1 MATE family efflux transporter [Helicobacter ibis]
MVSNAKLNLKSDSVIRLFFSYFLPSLVAMLALSTYSTIDGIFVGKKLGENALAAIGLAWPIFPVLIAFELLFGIGAAAMSSYFLGKGKAFRARIIFSSVFYFAAISSVVGGILLFYYSDSISLYLGASETLLPLVKEYTEIIYLGAFIIVLHPILDTFAINDRQPILAMVAMLVGAVMNVVLNYLFIFVFDWGLSGSALATVMGHGIGMLILLQHFLRKRGDLYLIRAFDIYAILMATKNGIPQSSAEISVSIMMLLFNHIIGGISGDRGLSIYSVLMYVGIIPFTILLSVAQGIQPIASYNYGAKLIDRVRSVFTFGIIFGFFVGVFMYGLSYYFSPYIIPLFLQENINARDSSLFYDIRDSMMIYFMSYILLGINMVSAIFFQSIQRTLGSLIITLSYTLIFALIFALILPKIFGFVGVMYSYPLGNLCACFVVVLVILYECKKGVLRNEV